MESITLSGDEEDELILDEGSTQSNDVSMDICLVGHFLTDQPINFNLMRSMMAGIWRPGNGVFMKAIGDGRYIFQFFHSLDVDRVVEGGPWAFNNIPLILHWLSKGEFPLQVLLDTLSFWVQKFMIFQQDTSQKVLVSNLGTSLEPISHMMPRT